MQNKALQGAYNQGKKEMKKQLFNVVEDVIVDVIQTGNELPGNGTYRHHHGILKTLEHINATRCRLPVA